MAVAILGFSKQGDNYVSDVIEAKNSDLAIQIKYENPGGTTLERSVDGSDFVQCALLMSYGDNSTILEKNVSGVVIGTNFRIRFLSGVIPSEIKVLQSTATRGDGYTDYDLESQMLFLPVRTTTITTKEGMTEAVASNDHIKIVDEDLKHYTLKEWNDRSVANGFDNSLVAKPIGFSMECNGESFVIAHNYQGIYCSTSGIKSDRLINKIQHSIYNYDQITSAASGQDSTITDELGLGTGEAGKHFSDDWEVRDNGDTLILYSGNTKQTWEMAKDCGNVNSMIATNFKERTDAMWAQNEWMRHRFAISSGITTSGPDGTIKEVQILNATGAQPQVGEDMYFYIDGTNTNLLAKYNLNNKHNASGYYLTQAVADYIYEQQKANGVNMNDTGVNSVDKPVLVPGAKGAEAIAVNGYWYIITPYIHHIISNSTSYLDNISDSPIIYYSRNIDNNMYILSERQLIAIYANINIIEGMINYLKTKEFLDSNFLNIKRNDTWSCSRYGGTNAWYVGLGSGYISANLVSGTNSAIFGFDFKNETL